ncbi:DNA repair protein RecN (Recombination protein N) [Cetobacterium ceti]|uniref:DNA repair protein RecN n=1 Tax=Cetobacterium ceti TaxID=180163 RepID=A0A1T4L1Z4_9FUSO|nr:DNA repair protein RecN [Cetobacterium ceti]SJZ48744.1 DNA repair protein RecN (Recombination protein N) [Cetobacterium ceti]
MLKELKIENLAIIDSLDVEFSSGLNVLTGETGAGKSIMLNGINLLIGEKATGEMIRDGEDKLVAQGIFQVEAIHREELSNLGILCDDGEIIVRRIIDKNGKGKIYINDMRVSQSTLKHLMGTLVDIVGQHSHQMLLNKNNHIKLLDKFLGSEGETLLKNIDEVYTRYSKIQKEIVEIEKNKQEALEKKEFYLYQLEEIEKVSPKLGEDEKLEEEYKKLFNGGKIREKLSNTEFLLREGENNALSIIHTSKKNLEVIAKYGNDFNEIFEKLDKIYYELEDCIDLISDLEKDIEVDDMALERVIKRIDAINKIKSKYGSEIKDILEFRDRIKNKLDLLEENSFQIKTLLKEKDSLEKKYKVLSKSLNMLRVEKSKEIEKLLQDELKYLNMEGAYFKISVENTLKMTSIGSDNVEFMISTNLGQGLKPLWKIASGGEVSRIMLALKVIFSRVDNIPLLIFDEIDTGVGGETVRKIADKLKEIGKSTQVISITHSPAIASKGQGQFYIEKNIENGKTVSTVKKLSSEERVYEIARMLAGKNVTEAVIEHAKELLNEG